MSKNKKSDTLGINGKFNNNKTRINSCLLHQFEDKTCSGWNKWAVGWFFISRERELLLSRFSVVRTVGSRRSKKQSRSTQQGLHVDTDLVEFRQF